MERGLRSTVAFLALALGACSQGQHTTAPGIGGNTPGAQRNRPAIAAVAKDTDSQKDFRRIINSAKARVFPAVVFIRSVQQDLSGGQRATLQVAGSGVIISESGEILTNWHVVDKAVELRCLLYDGQAYEAKVVGTDKDVDLALLQLIRPLGGGALDPARKFPFAEIGDSTELEEGDFVMAMGAPWGLSRSVSLGIISCTSRYLPEASEYSVWLQTDAAISPGNSGGPLVNTDGQLVGINTRGVMEGGDIGFAVPTETIVPVVRQLRQHGRVNWNWTGLQLQPLKDFNRNVFFEGNDGVIVAETDPDSPARQAGIQARDRILRVNGTPVTAVTDENLPELRRLFGLLPRTEPATLDILRGGQTVSLALTPREKGLVEGNELALPRWDLTVKTINQFDNPDLYFHQKQGVFVFGIRSPGNADASGLQVKDILLRVDDRAITSLDDLRDAHAHSLRAIDDKPRLLLTVLRNGLLRQVVMDISRDFSK